MDKTVASIRSRWDGAVSHGELGFTPVPDILIRSQSRLNLSQNEMGVLLNLLMHWWGSDQWPYPRISTISGRLGLSRRTVERTIASLEEKKLVVREQSESTDDGRTIRRFNLTGLRRTLREFAKERQTYMSQRDVTQQERARQVLEA